MKDYEKNLVEKIKQSDEEAFEELFFEYFSDLCNYSNKILKSRDLAKDAVQGVFMKIWKGRESWDVYYSIKVYLYKAVRNQSLNLLEKKNRQRDLSKELVKKTESEARKNETKLPENSSKKPDYVIDLVEDIWTIANEMPKRRRTVFTLHRKNGLSYKEIGSVMGIKRKTVENHMSLAFKTIRNNIDSNKLSSYRKIKAY